MDLELLFGLLLLTFVALWALWLFAIARGHRLGSLGLPVVLAGVLVAGLLVNGERGERKREDYRVQIETFIEAVAAEQERIHADTGAYSGVIDELSLDEDVRVYDEGGILQQEETIDATLSSDGPDSYTVGGRLDEESYTLGVERSRDGELTETRSCSSTVDAGCVDGAWEPAP